MDSNTGVINIIDIDDITCITYYILAIFLILMRGKLCES